MRRIWFPYQSNRLLIIVIIIIIVDDDVKKIMSLSKMLNKNPHPQLIWYVIFGKAAIWPDYVSDGQINWQLKTTRLISVYCLNADFVQEPTASSGIEFIIYFIKYSKWKWWKNHK